MDHKNSMVFKSITNRDDAFKMINEASMLFFVVAVIQVVFGYMLEQNMWIDAGMYLLLAFGLKYWNSRIAAVLLFILALSGFVMSFLMKLNVIESGGTNIVLAALILWIGFKTCDATFKYHKFKNE